ncbi:MAG: hypothetical protein WCF16_03405 [Alphaproteobacteria bacterium]
MTSLAEEKVEQARWVPRPAYRDTRAFDALVEGEFLPEAQQRANGARALGALVRFAAAQVPHYRDLFARAGLGPEDVAAVEDLPKLPPLSKREVAELGPRLCPRALPQGEEVIASTSSSGSTGTPTRVYRTRRSFRVADLLTQRQLRWYRFDPAGTFARIRGPEELSRPDGSPLADGETLRLDTWLGVGRMFVTGPFLGFSNRNTTEAKAEWLLAHRPDYLMARTNELEHIALVLQGREAPSGMRGMRAIGEPVTAGMKRRIEDTFHAPVHISFGLDETGWLATFCREGNCYHVHSEHCVAEVADGDGKPCPPGEQGRLLVTVLTNLAMPLIRYDTGDHATAPDGPCPCGRTLPRIGPDIGRRADKERLPAGTTELAAALLEAMEEVRLPLGENLREYRVHQTATGDFELRLVTAGSLNGGLAPYVETAWRAAAARHVPKPGTAPRLRLVTVDALERAPSGKFARFTSDLPDRAQETATGHG